MYDVPKLYNFRGRYPPYSDSNLKFISGLMRKRFFPSLKYGTYLLAFALGAGLSYGIFTWQKVKK